MADKPDSPALESPSLAPTHVRDDPSKVEETATADPLIGLRLGEYVVEEAVASGGMGIVYRARHPVIERKVAIKVLRPSFAADPESMSRFLKEAKAIAAIQHPGVIDIIGFGEVPAPDGRQYMVMEFLEGEPLDALIQRDRPMAPARALGLIDEVLDALSAAHKAGVVHRDLKPANIYIQRQSNGVRSAKLVDFGLARVAHVSELDRGSGRASMVAGTPEYVSPEQARGLAATPRSDLYCVGDTLFEMVTGRLPFSGPGMLDLLNAHVSQPAPRASSFVAGLPPALDSFIAQLLLKTPDERPASADVARQLIQRMMRDLQAEPTSVVRRPAGLALMTTPAPTSLNSEQTLPGDRALTGEQTLPAGTDPRLARSETEPVSAPPLPAQASARQMRIAAVVVTAVALVIGVTLALWARQAPVPRVESTEPAPRAPEPQSVPDVPPAPEPIAIQPAPQPEPKVEVRHPPAVRTKPTARALGTLSLTVTNGGKANWAYFTVDGKTFKDGQTPAVVTIEPGAHALRFWRDGITPIEKTVTVGSGSTQNVTVELRP
jgi:serine/threonine protein kinase